MRLGERKWRWPDAVVRPCYKSCMRAIKSSGLFCRDSDDGSFGSWRLKWPASDFKLGGVHDVQVA